MVMTRSQKLKMQGQENAEGVHGINFDDASQAWRAKKYSVGNGEWRYRCVRAPRDPEFTQKQSAQADPPEPPVPQTNSWRKLGDILFSILK